MNFSLTDFYGYLKNFLSLSTKLTGFLREKTAQFCSKLRNTNLKNALKWFNSSRGHYSAAALFDLALILMIFFTSGAIPQKLISPLVAPFQPLQPITENKSDYEVFGYAPHWTIDKLDNVDFNVLTTLSYFGMEVDSAGNILKNDPGYETFHSKKATALFRKAHEHGTRVVLTITQMQNAQIRALMDNPEAQQRLIDSTVAEVKGRGIDGINVDFEYMGDPGDSYRAKYTTFIDNLTNKMHQEVPGSKVSIAVYASAIKDPKIYDLAALGKLDIKVFMMAYDFGYSGSDQAIPTSPLYGYKEGKYWYDIATAVDDFIKVMPANKLILGNAWYGYNYPIVGEPQIKAGVRPSWGWRGRTTAQTFAVATENVKPNMEGITQYKEGWDDFGKVAWKAYYVAATDTWRMIFLEDAKSQGIKYDFAKDKKLAGVGMWALGFDDGKNEYWGMLAQKFGMKLADSSAAKRAINERI